MDYSLICAPGGSGFREAIALLEETIRKVRSDITIEKQDVEDVLCASASTRWLLEGLVKPEVLPTMFEVTYHLQREQVTRLWREALDQALTNLRYSNARIKLLTCHFTLYGGRRNELYSPLDMSLFLRRNTEPRRVMVLIDDIYDMYVRLTSKRHIFDEQPRLSQYLYEVKDEEGLSDEDLSKLAPQLGFEWRIATLAFLLSWRHADMLAAESFASQLNSPYLCFATKQLGRVAAKWLLNRNLPIYLSHPISRPRREFLKTGSWPDVVNEFNQLQSLLESMDYLSIMPTAIDEFRLERTQDKPLPRRTGRLGPRWEVRDPESSLFQLSSGLAGLERLVEETSEFDADLMLRGLEGQIKMEIAFRDHHLVANCPHLLVYRPLYQLGKYSAGVLAEIDHWNLLAADQKEPVRRASFVHFKEDVGLLIGKMRDQIRYRIGELSEQALQEAGWGIEQSRKARESIEEGGPTSSLLDQGFLSASERQELKDQWTRIEREATTRAIASVLMAHALPPGQSSIWIFDNFDQLRSARGEICSFYVGGEASDLWKEKALELWNTATTGLSTQKRPSRVKQPGRMLKAKSVKRPRSSSTKGRNTNQRRGKK